MQNLKPWPKKPFDSQTGGLFYIKARKNQDGYQINLTGRSPSGAPELALRGAAHGNGGHGAHREDDVAVPLIEGAVGIQGHQCQLHFLEGQGVCIGCILSLLP